MQHLKFNNVTKCSAPLGLTLLVMVSAAMAAETGIFDGTFFANTGSQDPDDDIEDMAEYCPNTNV